MIPVSLAIALFLAAQPLQNSGSGNSATDIRQRAREEYERHRQPLSEPMVLPKAFSRRRLPIIWYRRLRVCFRKNCLLFGLPVASITESPEPNINPFATQRSASLSSALSMYGTNTPARLERRMRLSSQRLRFAICGMRSTRSPNVSGLVIIARSGRCPPSMQ